MSPVEPLHLPSTHERHIHRALAVLLSCLLGVFSGCGGCSKGAEQEPPREALSTDAAAQQAAEPPELQWSLLLGEEDSTNRYPATVQVIVHDAADASEHKECSGVLVDPRLVLTAGHCVCQLDASRCAATATVVMVTSEPPTPEGVAEAWSVSLSGRVRPHPRFRLRLDSRGQVLSSTANLALIRLDQPVKKHIPPIRLAAEKAKTGELLTIVGYGYAEGARALDGKRRFSQEPVTGALDPDGERMRFGRPELSTYQGDTGGPCLREGPDGPALVGISSRGLGREPAFTSTYPYREWLQSEIQLAAEAPVPTSQDAPKP
jgi:hypothetical protein